ncbi:1-acyl-sn-glycerol-3-phosphate acyltransferase delta-like isoform X2 [Branchiostoma floridae]|uniref:1-acyl-sn-glycerol-3-phosphate acyltransferase delta-like isoform X2 n=2 Tax=Branchiostoma floridae TaxID=7739 RepID=A0A9J7N1G1_BRAFL|nr:1-acyl-sn-glycerol-3-phosphate acyltransferase delta-like isoform X2 [Branchiostoma floridae]XP_035686311.1 1-acyl-sn-glycerol-3-phosphate acyltransferase delta-like isoform X2 [Branchiostoma floridae]
MGLVSALKQFVVVHILIAYVFIVSGIICNIFQAAGYLLLRPISLTAYRKLAAFFTNMHWSQLVFLNEWWAGSTINMYGTDADIGRIGKENAVLLMNHKYETDMISGWTVCERFGCLGTSRALIKESVKYLPVVGWTMFFIEFLFLKRDYEEDKRTIVKQLKELQNYPDNFWLLLFCEGTRFTAEKHEKSMEVARKKGVPELKHHLLPRTRGFLLCAQGIREYIPAFYDVEIHFPNGSAEPTLMGLLKGEAQHAHIYVRRIPTEEVPEDEDACAEYCHELYRIKDRNFEYFEQNGRFPDKVREIPRRPYTLIIIIFWSVLLVVPLIKYLVGVVMSGSTLMIAGVIMGGVLVSLLLQKMMEVTQISKGSSYGHTKGNDKKKE